MAPTPVARRTTPYFTAAAALVACAAAAGCAAHHRALSLQDVPRATPRVEPTEPVSLPEPPAVASAAAEPEVPADDGEPPDEASPVADTLDVQNASKHYDFRVNMKDECIPSRPGGPLCFLPAELVVLHKGTEQDVQRIDLDRIDLVLGEHGRLRADAAGMYDWQGTLEIGDFNFDGREDFAVRNGEMGPYDSPTYCVFLYDPRQGRFVESDAFSQLTQENMGFFAVDTARRRLVVSSKSGCCDYATEEYAVVQGKLVLMESYEEKGAPGEEMTITRRVRQGDKWRTTVTTTSLTPNEP
jgi:hypothetical protein